MTRNRLTLIVSTVFAFALVTRTFAEETASVRTAVDRFCVTCHDAEEPKGGLNLASALAEEVPAHPEVWEKVARRLRGRQMPPAGKKRPSEDAYVSLLSQIEASLDRASAE